MPKQKNIDLVKDLTDKLNKAKAVVLADYTKLTHKQLEQVRTAVKKAEGELVVVKNTLLKKALADAQKTIDSSYLQGATVTLFAYADEAGPIKALTKFFKDFTVGQVKTGLLGTKELSQSQINQLASLPTRDVLLAKLVGQLQSPLYGLHNALSWNLRKLVWTLEAVRNKKSV